MKDDDGAKYPMVAVDAALSIVLEHAAPLPTEQSRSSQRGPAPALRRCLAESIEAAAPFPQFRAAISDGYCCAANGQEQTLRDDGSKQLAGTSDFTVPAARAATSRRALLYQRAPTPSRSRATALGMSDCIVACAQAGRRRPKGRGATGL